MIEEKEQVAEAEARKRLDEFIDSIIIEAEFMTEYDKAIRATTARDVIGR